MLDIHVLTVFAEAAKGTSFAAAKNISTSQPQPAFGMRIKSCDDHSTQLTRAGESPVPYAGQTDAASMHTQAFLQLVYGNELTDKTTYARSVIMNPAYGDGSQNYNLFSRTLFCSPVLPLTQKRDSHFTSSISGLRTTNPTRRLLLEFPNVGEWVCMNYR